MADFVNHAQKGDHNEQGWPNTCYGTSKLGVIALTKILARTLAGRQIAVNCFCPGYCATDMSSQRGTKTAAQGAETAVWLANLDKEARLTGGFFQDSAPREW
uniref:Uncharacterized protein n=2 Tax=Chrysotila carterae TaxID=13221 RepID=A0A7S4EXS5_CHRCT